MTRHIGRFKVVDVEALDERHRKLYRDTRAVLSEQMGGGMEDIVSTLYLMGEGTMICARQGGDGEAAAYAMLSIRALADHLAEREGYELTAVKEKAWARDTD